MKAAILAGGYGKRLRPLTENKPKPLIEICGKPIIEWQIMWLKKHGVRELVILTGYAKEKIIGYLGSGSKLDVSIVYTVEEEPAGTAGALKRAESVLKREDIFIVVNGDIITSLNPLEMVKDLETHGDAIAEIALVPLRCPYGIVKLRDNGFIMSFEEKPLIRTLLINAGVYVMRPEIFRYLPEKGDLEKLVFPKLASDGRLRGYIYYDCYWRAIDTIKDLHEAEVEVKRLFGSVS